MPEHTDTAGHDEALLEASLETSGHIERTIIHHLAGNTDGRYRPATVSDCLEDVMAVIERGNYGNLGLRTNATTVRKSSLRRTFTQLADKGLVERVTDLDPDRLADDRFALGAIEPGGDPTDPSAYAGTSDDARVTDWILTTDGQREVARLDARYERELDELAARFGRQRGETTARIDA